MTPAPLTSEQMEQLAPWELLTYLAEAAGDGVMARNIPRPFYRVRLSRCVDAIPGETYSLRDHTALEFLAHVQRHDPEPEVYNQNFDGRRYGS